MLNEKRFRKIIHFFVEFDFVVCILHHIIHTLSYIPFIISQLPFCKALGLFPPHIRKNGLSHPLLHAALRAVTSFHPRDARLRVYACHNDIHLRAVLDYNAA